MANVKASARPRKRFFVEMFTRDISLRDCILDLIDNAIDGLVKTEDIDLGVKLLQADTNNHGQKIDDLCAIKVKIAPNKVTVIDNCGGVSFKEAKTEMFNFGHSTQYYEESRDRSLGVYGVGLKRALFKIGKNFEITSKTIKDGFKVKVLDLDDWVKTDESFGDWSFPIEKIDKARSRKVAGTKIEIKKINETVKPFLKDKDFLGELEKEIARVYTFFINKFVTITLNDKVIDPINIPLGDSEDVSPATESFFRDSVSVDIWASLAARNEKGQWAADRAGWYIACNGRMVTTADRTGVTGWGKGILPQYQPKYRGFVGVVLFESKNPLKLPWKTTKRDLSDEASVYQQTRVRMGSVARKVISFLDSMYGSSTEEENEFEREIANKVKQADLVKISKIQQPQIFKTPAKKTPKKTTVVQYSVKMVDIQLVRKHIQRPSWSNSKVGRYTFETFMENEDLK